VWRRTGLAGLLVAVLASACSDTRTSPAVPEPSRSTSPGPATPSTAPPVPDPTDPSTEPAAAREPRRSFLSVPALRLRAVPVVRYRGTPDDAPGTRIQNRGPTASPRGPGGGVGPGDVGNFIVTGHRTSHAAPFAELPSLRPGDRVRVRSGATVFVYEVTGTRSTSFRSRASLARQSAAVPGRPGATAVDPMITLSTCATPEDHARGNYWSDRFGNPEHRIDKIGVLVATRQAPRA
jgi:sortase A